MSKLTENPAKVVPVRVLMIAAVLTIVISTLSIFLTFNLLWTLVFFWLATLSNLIAFRLIVIGAARLTEKQETDKKVTLLPNLMMRYMMYTGVLVGAWFAAGFSTLIAAFIGVQLASIAIKLDSFVG